jgi:hypothetical protein
VSVEGRGGDDASWGKLLTLPAAVCCRMRVFIFKWVGTTSEGSGIQKKLPLFTVKHHAMISTRLW